MKYFLRLGDLKLVKVNTLDDYITINTIVFIYQAGLMNSKNSVAFIYVFNLEECYFTQIKFISHTIHAPVNRNYNLINLITLSYHRKLISFLN